MSIFAKLFGILVEKHLSQVFLFPLIRDAVLFVIPSKVPLDSRGLSVCTVFSDNCRKKNKNSCEQDMAYANVSVLCK